MKSYKETLRKFFIVYASLLVVTWADAQSFVASKQAELANFDKRSGTTGAGQARGVSGDAGEAHLRAVIPDVKIDRDEILGTPQWITSPRGWLSGPKRAKAGNFFQ